jgi:hypothetical protein
VTTLSLRTWSRSVARGWSPAYRANPGLGSGTSKRPNRVRTALDPRSIRAYISRVDISDVVRHWRLVSGRVAEFGWFAEPALLVLVSLSHGPKHGYAIVHDIEHGTGRVAQIGLRHLDRTSP